MVGERSQPGHGPGHSAMLVVDKIGVPAKTTIEGVLLTSYPNEIAMQHYAAC